MEFREEVGRLDICCNGQRISSYNVTGFFPYRVASPSGVRYIFMQNVSTRYNGPSGGDNHRIYRVETVTGEVLYVYCSDSTVIVSDAVAKR